VARASAFGRTLVSGHAERTDERFAVGGRRAAFRVQLLGADAKPSRKLDGGIRPLTGATTSSPFLPFFGSGLDFFGAFTCIPFGRHGYHCIRSGLRIGRDL